MNTFFTESWAVIRSVGASFLHILPLLALTIPLAVYLKRSGLSRGMQTLLRGNQVLAVLIATIIGAVSPLCSCGVIPVIAGLLTAGVPLAPVMAFWLASPSMDPEIFLLSGGILGWDLAVWRLVATSVMSFGAGLMTIWIEKKGLLGGDILRGSRSAATSCKGAGCTPKPSKFLELASASASGPTLSPLSPSLPLLATSAAECGSALPAKTGTCGCAPVENAMSRFRLELKPLAKDALTLFIRLSAYMGIAFLLEALIKRYLPSGFVSGLLGQKSAFAVPLATLVGIPLYTTELAAMGLVSGLLAQGMAPAAALSFLVGGGVTTIPAMSAVWGIVRWRVFALYLGFCVSGALLAGYSLQFEASL